MTVFIQTARTRFTADGVATLFHIFWPFIDVTHVTVIRKASGSELEAQLVPNVDYTVIPPTGPWPNGAFFSIPLGAKNAVGDTIAFLRAEPVKQDVDYVENDPFPAATHESALDWQTYYYSRTAERFSRALLIRDSDPIGGGKFNAMNNRISALSDPVDGDDAATKSWVLAQISNPVGWAPDKNLAQWNADRLQGRAVQNVAPTDGYVLKWSATNGRWEPQPAVDAASLLASNNTWAGSNTFNGAVTVANDFTMSTASKSINFAALGQRIKGRFYGTPHADRTLFTSNAAAQPCIIGVLPTAAGGDAGIGYYGNNDPDNASVLYIAANSTGTLIQAAHTGAGVTQPILFAVDSTLAMEILQSGKTVVNQSSDVTGAQFQVGGLASRNCGGVSVHRNNVAFNVPNTTFTKIDFTVEEYDEWGWYDLAIERFQPTVPGWYIVAASGGPDGVVAAGIRAHVSIFKNGAIYKTLVDVQGGGGTAMSSAGACHVHMNGSTDYIELFAWQNSGGNQSWGGGPQDCYLQILHQG